MDDRLFTIRIAKATAAVVAVAATVFGLWEVRSVIILLLVAVTFASAMPPGGWLPRTACRSRWLCFTSSSSASRSRS